ncbi:MAG: hypothetical protein EG826_09990 [Deltaproteobacteria bacterium]|nr:hypothetical protein [Deltaproteobacteria bacterium]
MSAENKISWPALRVKIYNVYCAYDGAAAFGRHGSSQGELHHDNMIAVFAVSNIHSIHAI